MDGRIEEVVGLGWSRRIDGHVSKHEFIMRCPCSIKQTSLRFGRCLIMPLINHDRDHVCIKKPFADVASVSPRINSPLSRLFVYETSVSVVYFIANRRDITRLIFGYGLMTLSWWRVLFFLCRSRLLGDPLHVVIDPSDGSCRHNYDISDRISWPESQGYKPRHARSQFRSMSIYSSFGGLRLWRTRRYTP